MAFQGLSIGDILMLSGHACNIGRAFTSGRNGAHSEFAEVEREANGLSEALKLTAETLHSNGSILSRAEPETRGAVTAILESAGRTLAELESFVERYQVIRKRVTSSGFVVERSWSEVILANYKTIKWTTEGGDITELRNILQMHTNTINLTLQALQSRSLARLEKTVIPMAENIASIHSRVNGDLGEKIDDLHRIIMAIANSTPSLVARDRAINDGRDRSSTISSLGQGESLGSSPPGSGSMVTARRPERYPHDSVQSTPALLASRSFKADSFHRSPGSMQSGEPTRMDRDFEAGSPPRMIVPVRGALDDVPSTSGAERSPSISSNETPDPYRREPSMPRRESSTLPNLFHAISEEEPHAESSRYGALKNSRHVSYEEPVSPISRSSKRNSYDSIGQPVLPPPAIPHSPTGEQARTPATPSSFFNELSRSRSDLNNSSYPSRPQTAKSVKIEEPKSPALSTLASFEKPLFRNAAILCDVRCKLIEYAQQIPDEPDPRYNVEMVEACKDARICVIRKRENRDHGGTKVATSIWALSEDGNIRCQLKLSDTIETVPYCSYFEQEKVSIPPTEGDMCLRFHGKVWGDDMEREVNTNWVNYILASENDAIAFQSAVYGRMLIGSFRTMKTIVVHEGIKGAFTFEEQFANIEMLRLWEDDGVSTPGAQGGVLALMHISSNFGEGWARWWMNCSRQQVRVKADGSKFARLKGIDIVVVKPGSSASTADKIRSPSTAGEGLQRVETRDGIVKTSGKKIQVKRVTGVKIEFKTEEERRKFVEMSSRVQQRMIPLPDI